MGIIMKRSYVRKWNIYFDYIYQYLYNPMDLYRANENQPAIRLDDYQADYFEQGITRVFLCVLGLTQLSEL